MTENELSNKVIGIAMEVHSALGPGLLGSAYKACLYYKIAKSGLHVEAEKPMPFKLTEGLNDVHLAQVLTYLKLGNYKLGLLMNFNVTLLKNGIKRVVNNL
jgi:hypothetical protein